VARLVGLAGQGLLEIEFYPFQSVTVFFFRGRAAHGVSLRSLTCQEAPHAVRGDLLQSNFVRSLGARASRPLCSAGKKLALPLKDIKNEFSMLH
jgi:hypothetical protein